MGSLQYDPVEIEHPMYMFNHQCVGCVVLRCAVNPDRNHLGRALLDGVKLPECFVFDFVGQNMPPVPILGVRVRGYVEYGKHYTLTLEGFRNEEGEEIEPVSYPLTVPERSKPAAGHEAHDAVALQAAREGMVLLKNESGVLPLAEGTVLNLFGSGVTNYRISAIGAGKINPRYVVGIREAIELNGSFTLNPELDDFYRAPQDGTPDREMLLRARALSDTAVIMLTRGTGENIDNQPIPGEYYLTEAEESMIAAVSGVFDKTVAVLNTGYPIHMEWIRKYGIKAVLYSGIAGQGGAQALCEILSGQVNPSGRLTDTWAWDYYDIPSSVNFYCPPEGGRPVLADDVIWADTCYEEGIYVGYRYFESFGKQAAFAFGHGLSYTEFERKAGPARLQEDGGWQVEVSVTNVGSRSGKEVVALYVKLPGTLQEQPAKQLAAFSKTKELAPGQTQTLLLKIARKQLATYLKSRNAWVLEPGETVLYLGGSVQEACVCGSIVHKEEVSIQKLKYRMDSPLLLEEISWEGRQWPAGGNTKLRPELESLSYQRTPQLQRKGRALPKSCGQVITWPQVVSNPDLLEAFVGQMTQQELCRLNVMYCENWGMEKKGAAGSLAVLEPYELPDYTVCDGNSGLNLFVPNIGMPASVVTCSSWNTALARKVGKVIGEEAVENGIRLVLATAMNIHRNPLNGRNPEYFSEDPCLAGIMAGSQVKGMHEAGISDSVKHVICNNCETSRKRNHSLVGERALRGIYLRAFEMLIDTEKPDTIMTSYNGCNGCMTAENTVLLEGIFREELGFDGFVMTDWNSYDTADMARAVNAGVSWLTPGEKDGTRVSFLMEAVRRGEISMEILQENIYRMMRIILLREKKSFN